MKDEFTELLCKKTKKELIDILYEEFERDKETIKKNIIDIMPNCFLEVKNDFYKAKLTVEIQRLKEEEDE